MSQAALVDQIMAVMDAAFDPAWGEAWNRRQVSDALLMPNTHALLIDSQGLEMDPAQPQLAAGFVLTRHAADEEELLLIAVRPEHRGRGVGQKLIGHLIRHARQRNTLKIFLEMRRNNPAAHLYHKVGFAPIGRRQNYYLLANGERMDAITFALSIE